MGAGSFLEAAYTLTEPVGTGTLNLIADGVCQQSVDVKFEVLVRHDATDTVLLDVDKHFDPLPETAYRAQAFETSTQVTTTGVAGDEIILRFTGTNSERSMAFFPNGDGTDTAGRIPYIELPKPIAE